MKFKRSGLVLGISTIPAACLILAYSSAQAQQKLLPPSTEYDSFSSDWFNASNWTSGVPDSSTDAIVDNGAELILNNNAEARSLFLGVSGNNNELEIDGASFTASNSVFLASPGYAFPAPIAPLDTEGDFTSTNSDIFITSSLIISNYEFLDGPITSDGFFEQTEGSLIVGSNVLVGGGQFTFLNTGDINSDARFDLTDVSQADITNSLNISQIDLSAWDSRIEDSGSINIENSDLDISGNMTVGYIDGDHTGFLDIDPDADFEDSDLSISGQLMLGVIDDSAGGGVVDLSPFMCLDTTPAEIGGDFVMATISGDNQNRFFTNVGLELVNAKMNSTAIIAGTTTGGTGVEDNELILEDSFLNIVATSSRISDNEPSLVFGPDIIVEIDANGMVRANSANVTTEDNLYSAFDLDVLTNNKTGTKGGVQEPVVLGGILNFGYNGNVDPPVGFQFELIRINDSSNLINTSFDGIEVRKMPIGLTLKPVVVDTSLKGINGRSFMLEVIETQDLELNLSKGIVFDWDDAQNWSPAMLPNLGSDVLITNGVEVVSQTSAFADQIDVGGLSGSGIFNYSGKISVNDELRVASPDSAAIDANPTQTIPQEMMGELFSNNATTFIARDLTVASPGQFSDGNGKITGFVQLSNQRMTIGDELIIAEPSLGSNSPFYESVDINAGVLINDSDFFKVKDAISITSHNNESDTDFFADVSVRFVDVDNFAVDNELIAGSLNSNGSGDNDFSTALRFQNTRSTLGDEIRLAEIETDGTGFVRSELLFRMSNSDIYTQDSLILGELSGTAGNKQTRIKSILQITDSTLTAGSFRGGEHEGNTPGYLSSLLIIGDSSLLEINPGNFDSGDFEPGSRSRIGVDVKGLTRVDDTLSDIDTYGAINIENSSTIELDGWLELNILAPGLQEFDSFDIIRATNSSSISGDFDLVTGYVPGDLALTRFTTSSNGVETYVVRVVESGTINFTGALNENFFASSVWDQGVSPIATDRVRISNGGSASLAFADINLKTLSVASQLDTGAGELEISDSTIALSNLFLMSTDNPDSGTFPAGSNDLDSRVTISDSEIHAGGGLLVGSDFEIRNDGTYDVASEFTMDGGSLQLGSNFDVASVQSSDSTIGSELTNAANVSISNLDLLDVEGDLVVADNTHLNGNNRATTTTANVLLDNIKQIRLQDLEIGNSLASEEGVFGGVDATLMIRDSVINAEAATIGSTDLDHEANAFFETEVSVFLDGTCATIDEVILGELRTLSGMNPDSFSSSTLSVVDSTLNFKFFNSALGSGDGDIHAHLDMKRSYLSQDQVASTHDPVLNLNDSSLLTFHIEGDVRADAENAGTPGIYSAIDLRETDLVEIELNGKIVANFNHPTVGFGSTFDLIRILDINNFNQQLPELEANGLPEGLFAEGSIVNVGQGQVYRVEIVRDDLLFVGSNLDNWDESENWNLDIVPTEQFRTFVNNGNTAIFTNDNSSPGRVRELNVATNGSSSGIFFQTPDGEGSIRIEEDLNIGYVPPGESFPTSSKGELLLIEDASPDGYFQGNGIVKNGAGDHTIRFGVADQSDAEMNLFRSLNVSSKFSSGFNILKAGIANSSGNARVNIDMADSDFGDYDNVTVGSSFGNGQAFGSLIADSIGINEDLVIGSANGPGDVSGNVFIDSINGNDYRLSVGTSSDAGEGFGNISVQNTGFPVIIDLGVSIFEGDATGFLSGPTEIVAGSSQIPSSIEIGTARFSGSANGSLDISASDSVNQQSIRGFNNITVGRSVDTAFSSASLFVPNGVQSDSLNIGELDLTASGIGVYGARRGLTDTTDLTVGLGAIIQNGINGISRGFFSSGSYHAFDTDNATLAGVLSLDFGYQPQDGDSFDIIRSANGISNSFGAISARNLNANQFISDLIISGSGSEEILRVTVSGTADNPDWIDPGSDDWFDISNWSTNRVPDAGDATEISNGGTAIIIPTDKGPTFNLASYTLDVGVDGGEGSLIVEDASLRFAHALSVGHQSVVSSSTTGTSGTFRARDIFVSPDFLFSASSERDPSAEFGGINFGLANGDGSSNADVQIIDSDIFLPRTDQTVKLRVASAQGSNASAKAKVEIIAEDENGSFSRGIFGNGMMIGDASAASMGILNTASAEFDVLFDNILISLNEPLSVVSSNSFGVAESSSSGSLEIKESFIESGLDGLQLEATEGSDATGNLGLMLTDTILDDNINIGILSAEGNSLVEGNLDFESQNSSFGANNLNLMALMTASDGGVLNADWDVVFSSSPLNDIEELNILSGQSSGSDSQLIGEGVAEIFLSDIRSNQSVTLANNISSEDSTTSVTADFMFVNSNMTTVDDILLANDISASMSGITRTDLDFDITGFSPGFEGRNISLAGAQGPLNVSDQGVIESDISMSYAGGRLVASEMISIGHMMNSGNGSVQGSVSAEISFAFVRAETLDIGRRLDNGAAASDFEVSALFTDARIQTDSVQVAALDGGTQNPDATLALNDSYLLTDDFELNEGATLQFKIEGFEPTRNRLSKTDKVSISGPNGFYPTIDVVTTATLDGELLLTTKLPAELDTCITYELILITADTLIGDFDSITLPQDPRGTWSVEVNRQTNQVIARFEVTELPTLTYIAATGGSISENAIQTIDCGNDGAPVTAVADTGFIFDQWSDFRTDNPRTDSNIQADLTVTAQFLAVPVSVTLSRTPNTPANGIFAVTADFSQEVTGFDTTDISTTLGATVSGITQDQSDPTVYEIEITPNTQGTIEVSIPASTVAASGSGAGNTESNTVFVVFDSIRPTATLFAPDTQPFTEPFTVQVLFSENVSLLSEAGIMVTNGIASNITRTTLQDASFTITPINSGQVTIQLIDGAVIDIATNRLEPSAILNVDVFVARDDLFIIR